MHRLLELFSHKNIGEKIKLWANGLALILYIFAGYFGISLVKKDEDLAVIGFLIFICGVFLGHIASCFLYAFGELVEKTIQNERNTRTIVELLKEQYGEKTKPTTHIYNKHPKSKTTNKPSQSENAMNTNLEKPVYPAKKNDTIICPSCNYEQPSNRKVCWHCGAKFEDDNEKTISHQWLCENCRKMRTQTPCEHCGKE